MVRWKDKQIRQILVRLTKEKKRIEINKIINGKGDSTTDTIEIQKIITGNYKRLYTNILYNLEKNGKILRSIQPIKA